MQARTTDPDAAARRSLAKSRLFATGLLVLMGCLTLASYAVPPGWAAELLQAAAKAGFIGGIADWFAVTALFRHPLGLPIPHTAILPRQKERLGRALGRFVANYVVTQDEVGRIVERLDVPGILQRFLADPASSRPAAEALAAMIPRALASVEDGRARRLINRLIPRLVGGAGASRVVARALRGLVEGGRHQEVLGFILVALKQALAAREDAIQRAVEERVREQGGRLVGWAVGATVARRVLTTINAELDRMDPEGSEIREAFDEWVRQEIERMETDPQRAAEIGAALRNVVMHETVQVWLWDVWARLRQALEAEAANPSGRTIQMIEGGLANLGTMLATDPGARRRVQAWSETMIARLLPAARVNVAEFIANVVASWDTATITDRLELRVGKDLQFVRVNGTLVGFLVGGLLYAVLHAIFGTVAF
jgi:uncharacterized membrane-anchored protein YjiN (DUF445 family)